MDGFEFDTKELLDSIRRNEWFHESVTEKDLENPTAQFVQTVFFKFLVSIGVSETLLNTNQTEFCILEELGEHAGKILFFNIKTNKIKC